MTLPIGMSQAPRLMACAASVRMGLNKPYTEETQRDTLEGRDVHWVAEQVLKAAKVGNQASAEQYVGRICPDGTLFTSTMATNVSLYIHDVLNEARMTDGDGELPNLLVEWYDDMSWFAPGVKCIVDAAVYSDYCKRLIVWDYKNGRTPRNPMYDWQLIGNTAALLRKYPDTQSISIRVIQPNSADGESPAPWEVEPHELAPFIEQLRQRCLEAQAPDAACNPGSHCVGCGGAAVCQALQQRVAANTAVIERWSAEPQDLAPDQLAAEVSILKTTERMIKARKEALELHALHMVDKRGLHVPGYKLVNRTAHRKITNPDEFVSMAHMLGYSDKLLFNEPKLHTPAQLEQKGVSADLLEMYVEKPDNGKQLVPESSTKPATASTLVEMFSNVK